MLLDYSSHCRWLWFTGAAFLAALGAYAGLGGAPWPRAWPGPGGPALLVLVALGLAVLRAWGPRRRWARAVVQLAAAALGGAGLVLLGGWLGRRWAVPGGPAASSVAGVWFGLLAGGCMLFAVLLSGLRRLPSVWPLGPRAWWLKGHIWLGLLCVPLVFFHSAGRPGGPLECALWVLLVLVVGTGLLGLALQQFLPHLLTTRLTAEAPYEQIPHLCLELRRKADVLAGELSNAASEGPARDEVRKTYAAVVRPFLAPDYDRSSPLARPAQAAALFQALRAVPGLEGAAKELARLAQLEAFCADRRALGEQERLHHWLHLWLFAHVPLSLLLLALVVLHAVVAMYY
jgi:hypothetical protein